MFIVRDLLKIKGGDVWSITPDTSVLEALELMAEKGIGALLVLEGDQIAGIISERDFVRSIAKTGRCLVTTMVRDYMTQKVVTIEPDEGLDEVMRQMTKEHIRHLPVVENGKLIGLISIGDVVKELISTKESTINILENYIQGRGYGQ